MCIAKSLRSVVATLAGLLLTAVSAQAQEPSHPICKEIAGLGHRVAIVIGNDTYISPLNRLSGPTHDADDIAKELCWLGFDDTYVFKNSTFDDMAAALDLLEKKVVDADMVLFFYSGHGGVGRDGQNYLVPVDFNSPLSQLQFHAMSLDAFRDRMGGAKPNALRLVILDACRDQVKGAGGMGIGPLQQRDDNSLVVYAAAFGSSALTDPDRRNSFFTEATLKYLRDHDKISKQDIQTIFRYVAIDVKRITKEAQKPATYVAAPEPYYFLPNPDGWRRFAQAGGLDELQKLQMSNLLAMGDKQKLLAMGLTTKTAPAAPGVSYITAPPVGNVPGEGKPAGNHAGPKVVIEIIPESGFPDEGFVFPQSSSRLLNKADLAAKSPQELRLGRNEIYARHGYRFVDPELLKHFLSFSWYLPRGPVGSDETVYEVLSDIERANIEKIAAQETRLKAREQK